MCHFGEEIRRGRRDNEEIRVAGEFDMAHAGIIGRREKIVVHSVAGQAFNRELCDESLRSLRHGHADEDAPLAQAADQFEHLISRDAPPMIRRRRLFTLAVMTPGPCAF